MSSNAAAHDPEERAQLHKPKRYKFEQEKRATGTTDLEWSKTPKYLLNTPQPPANLEIVPSEYFKFLTNSFTPFKRQKLHFPGADQGLLKQEVLSILMNLNLKLISLMRLGPIIFKAWTAR